MKIEKQMATIKYDYNIDNLLKAFSTVTTEARGKTEEEFKNHVWIPLMKDLQATLRNTKSAMNKDTGVYEATFYIIKPKQWPLMKDFLANSFFFSFRKSRFAKHITN